MEQARKEAEANASRLKEAERQAAQVQKARQEGDLSTAEEKKALEKLKAEQQAAATKERTALAKLKAEQEAQSARERAAVAKFKAEQESLLDNERKQLAELKAQQEAAAARAGPETTAPQASRAEPAQDYIAPSPVELPKKASAGKEEASSPLGALVGTSCSRSSCLYQTCKDLTIARLCLAPTLAL